MKKSLYIEHTLFRTSEKFLQNTETVKIGLTTTIAEPSNMFEIDADPCEIDAELSEILAATKSLKEE